MKVKDLIEKLQKFDPELPVMVDGYEGGETDLEDAREILVALNHNDEPGYGKHERIDEDEVDSYRYKDAIKVKAILLPR